MKETVKFTLEHETARQRFYKSNKPLVYSAKGKEYYELGKTWKVYADIGKSETKDFIVPMFFDYVIVSDAHTHIERLCFPGFSFAPIIGKCPAIFKCDNICGYNTFMSHGGDERSVHPDAVYLRMIAKANGYKMGRDK